jgi:hypothetical protein
MAGVHADPPSDIENLGPICCILAVSGKHTMEGFDDAVPHGGRTLCEKLEGGC